MSFKLVTNVGQINATMRARGRRLVFETAQQIRSTAQISMTGPKSGAVYKLRGGIEHQASAPGEAPAVETGNLINSIQVEQEGDLRAVVFTNVEYAAVLEFGGARVAPRPYFGPAFEQAKSIFQAGIRDLLNS